MRQGVWTVLAAGALFAGLPVLAGGAGAEEEPRREEPGREEAPPGEMKEMRVPGKGVCEACKEARAKAEKDGGIQVCEQEGHKRGGSCWWVKLKDQVRPFHCEACAKLSSEAGAVSPCETCKAERGTKRPGRKALKPVPKVDGEGKGGAAE